MQCRQSVLEHLEKLSERLATCQGTDAFKLWDSYVQTQISPHHKKPRRRNLLSSSYALSRSGGRRGYVPHEHQRTPALLVHFSFDQLAIGGSCDVIAKGLDIAVQLADISNDKIKRLDVTTVQGKSPAEIANYFEGLATVMHGDIGFHWGSKPFWNVFNGLSMNHLPPNYGCERDSQGFVTCYNHIN